MTVNAMRSQHKAIDLVTRAGLCIECGTCISACPFKAIKMVKKDGVFIPIIFRSKCSACGLCYRVCPGSIEEVFRQIEGLAEFRRGDDGARFDPYIGYFINTYIAYSSNNYIRYYSSSGGVVSTLLLYLLLKKYVDAVVTVCDTADERGFFEPRPCIINSAQDFLKKYRYIAGSRYRSVPLNEILKDIANNERIRSVAFVGLPCHIRGLKNLLEIDNRLQEKDFIIIGLFCNNVPTSNAQKYLLTKVAKLKGWEVDKVTHIIYRGRGWPGYLTIELKDGYNIIKPFFDYWDSGFGQFFAHKRCLVCTDQTAELADISVGDAWLPELISKDKIGTSIVITRSTLGDGILNEAANEGYLMIQRIPHKKTIQQAAIFRKQLFKSWLKHLKLGYPVHIYIDHREFLPAPSFVARLWYYYLRIGMFLAKYEKTWDLLYIYALLFKSIREAVRVLLGRRRAHEI